MISQNVFLQGAYDFSGAGLAAPQAVDAELTHTVPDGVVAQAVYFRGGNSSDELAVVSLVKDGVPVRLFPIGAQGSVHVPLRIVEDLIGGTVVELQVAAPDGVSGTIVVDLGLVEV